MNRCSGAVVVVVLRQLQLLLLLLTLLLLLLVLVLVLERERESEREREREFSTQSHSEETMLPKRGQDADLRFEPPAPPYSAEVVHCMSPPATEYHSGVIGWHSFE